MAGRARIEAPSRPVTYEEWRATASESRQSEWVDGEVIEFMPTKLAHALASGLLMRLLAWFVERHDVGVVIGPPFEMRLVRSAREPDILFVAAANLDRLGDLRLDGPADLVVELISDDSVARDRVEKRAEYEAAGVREYWIHDPRPGRQGFELLVLGDDGHYAPVAPDATGRFHSAVLPGLWIDPAWIRRDPLPKLTELTDAVAAGERAAR